MASVLDRVYARSPVLIQHAMATGYGLRQRWLRYGGRYAEHARTLARQQWLSRDQLQQIQDAAVRRTVAFAAREVPYYRDLFARERLRPEDIQTARDLTRLPMLDKATVQAEGPRLRPDRLTIKAARHLTGGTTGTPVPYWVSNDALQFYYATYEVRFRAWAGIDVGDRMVSINGQPIVPMTQHGPPYWRHNLAFNQLYVSAYHLSEAQLPAIVERIRAFEPRVIVGYPSSVRQVARYLLDRGLAGTIRPHAVLLSSETLFPWLREECAQAFGCKVWNGYSLGEPVCFVSECPAGRMHESPEFGVIELVEGEGGHEIVATGLINDAMPMLRYRTGDLATPGDGTTCSCGRGLPTLGSIIGRVDEAVVTPEGVEVGPTALGLAFKHVSNLREAQIVQEEPSAIMVKLVVTPEFGATDETTLRAELHKRLGPTIMIELERVEAIPRTRSGKQRLVITRRGART